VYITFSFAFTFLSLSVLDLLILIFALRTQNKNIDKLILIVNLLGIFEKYLKSKREKSEIAPKITLG